MNGARWIGPGRLTITAAAAGGLVALAAMSPAAPASRSGQPTGDGPTRAPVTTAALSCPGPELSGIDGVDDIDVPARVGAATAPDSVLGGLTLGGSGSLVFRSGDTTSDSVDERGVTATEAGRAAAATDVVASGRMAPALAASQEWAVSRAEINGLATVPCAGPGSDVWLLAGGGAPGRQERLVLTNPGSNEVTVDLQVLGRNGPVPAPTGATVVPAHGRVALLVDAITGAEESPAVRVRVNGGAVRAVMSDIWLDGSVAAGAETSGPTAAPSTRQVIPGALVGASGGSIRIAVPGQKQAVVSARILGKDGAVPLPGGGVIRVPGRSTGELAVTDLKPGTYAVEITADVPIAAALWASQRVAKTPGDFLWAPSTEPMTEMLGGAYPESDDERSRTASITASGGPAVVTVTWRAAGKDGNDTWSTRQVSLAQDTSTTVDLGDASSVWVERDSGTGELRASVVTVSGPEVRRMVSVAPLVDTAVTSKVSSAHPIS